MGKHGFTPRGMMNSHSIPLSWNESYEVEKQAPINVVVQFPVQINTKEEKKSTGESLKDLLVSIKDLSTEERRFAIKAHYGLLTAEDVESIL